MTIIILLAYVSLTSYKTFEKDEPPLFRVMYGDPWGNYSIGYIDKAGNMVVDYIYNDGEEFHEGLAAVKDGREWGILMARGKWLLKQCLNMPMIFQEVWPKYKLMVNGVLLKKRGICRFLI